MATTTSRMDRRTLLKLMGSAGATATVISTTGCSIGQSVSASGLTGGKFDKSVPLATDGPGGNSDWMPGDAVKFLPPSDIPTRGTAADALAALPKEKLLRMYELMSASRKWETAMKDLFLGAKDDLYGAFHTYVGEEAIAVGVMGALNDDDYIASTHRGHGHLIAKGGDLNKMSAEIFFKATRLQQGLRRLDAHHRHVQGHHGHERHRRRQLLHGGRAPRCARRCAARSRWASRSSATARRRRRTTSAPCAAAPT